MFALIRLGSHRRLNVIKKRRNLRLKKPCSSLDMRRRRFYMNQRYFLAKPEKEQDPRKTSNEPSMTQQIKDKAMETLEKGKEKINDLKNKAQEKWEESKDTKEKNEREMKDKSKSGEMKDKVEKVKEKAGEMKDKVKEKAGEMKDKVGEMKDKVKEKTGEMKEKTGEMKDKVKEKAGEMKDKVGEMKDKVKEKAGEMKYNTESSRMKDKDDQEIKLNDEVMNAKPLQKDTFYDLMSEKKQEDRKQDEFGEMKVGSQDKLEEVDDREMKDKKKEDKLNKLWGEGKEERDRPIQDKPEVRRDQFGDQNDRNRVEDDILAEKNKEKESEKRGAWKK